VSHILDAGIIGCQAINKPNSATTLTRAADWVIQCHPHEYIGT